MASPFTAHGEAVFQFMLLVCEFVIASNPPDAA
jgi:hypothetical protein